MGRAVNYRPTTVTSVTASEKECYMSIARQIHEEPVDAPLAVERINKALDAIRMLEMEDEDGADVMREAYSDTHDVEKSAECEVAEEVAKAVCQHEYSLPSTPCKGSSSGCADGSPMLVADVPSPTRARARMVPHLPIASVQKDNQPDVWTSIDRRSVGTASELREKIERRQSTSHAVEMSPTKQIALAVTPRSDEKDDVCDVETAQLRQCVDRRSVGTAHELREAFEHGQQKARAVDMSPTKQIELAMTPRKDEPEDECDAETAQLRQSVDRRSVGTAHELREALERRQSKANVMDMSPGNKMARISIGSHGLTPRAGIGCSPASRNRLGSCGSIGSCDSPLAIDASAHSPSTDDYVPPAEGNSRQLKHFFEKEMDKAGQKSDDPSKRNRPKMVLRPKMALSDLLKKD